MMHGICYHRKAASFALHCFMYTLGPLNLMNSHHTSNQAPNIASFHRQSGLLLSGFLEKFDPVDIQTPPDKVFGPQKHT